VEKKRSWVQEGVPGKKNMFTTFKEKVHLIWEKKNIKYNKNTHKA
jgi:hypothetical protein